MKKEESFTPAQSLSNRLWANARAMENLVRIKNSIYGLSPKTRELWLAFKDSAWEDMKFQKRQKEMYQQNIEEDINALKKVNQTNYEKKKYEKLSAFKKTTEKQMFNCTACQDTGERDRALGLVAYCPCPRGIEVMYGPNWKETDDKSFWECTVCKTVFSKRKLHGCVLEYQLQRNNLIQSPNK